MSTKPGNIFSKVYKAVNIFEKNNTATIYSRTGSGMIFNMQFIGAVNTTISDDTVLWQGFERTTIEAVTDGHVFFRGKIYEFLGMNTDIASIDEYPRNGFYTPLFVKGGKFSGITLNFKIPYYENIEIRLIRDEKDINTPCVSWITIKDTDQININYSGISVPYGAYLHSEKIIKELDVGEELTLLNSSDNGMVMSISLFGKSDKFNFVEGCLRAYIKNNPPMLLSSGFEDYFGFCFGFNLGLQQFPMFGSTLYEMTENSNTPYRVSAYRNHIDDTLFFNSGGFKITVRNSDQNSGNMDLSTTDNMAGDPTGHSSAVMGRQITYYEWK